MPVSTDINAAMLDVVDSSWFDKGPLDEGNGRVMQVEPTIMPVSVMNSRSLGLPSFRRAVSFVGKDRGFEILGPDDLEFKDYFDSWGLYTESKMELSPDTNTSCGRATSRDVSSSSRDTHRYTRPFPDLIDLTRDCTDPTDSLDLNYSTQLRCTASPPPESTALPSLALDFDACNVGIQNPVALGAIPTQLARVRVKQEQEEKKMAVKQEGQQSKVKSELSVKVEDTHDDMPALERDDFDCSDDDSGEKENTKEKIPKDTHHNPDDDKITCGIYTKAQRRAKIAHFKAKKKNRVWKREIMYHCRKKFADRRPRIGGRFVTTVKWDEMKEEARQAAKAEGREYVSGGESDDEDNKQTHKRGKPQKLFTGLIDSDSSDPKPWLLPLLIPPLPLPVSPGTDPIEASALSCWPESQNAMMDVSDDDYSLNTLSTLPTS